MKAFPSIWNPTNVLDMHHWCRVLRPIYDKAGDRDAVERTYMMCSRIRRLRTERGFELTKLATEGFDATREEPEHPYR